MAEDRPGPVAVRVYPTAAFVSTRLPKVAIPLTAATLAVVPPPAKVPPLNVSVTVDVSAVTVLPKASSTATATAGLMAAPAVASLGAWANASWVAAAALIVNGP